ncbi:MAG: hypothetical protein SV377_03350, partial [Halobacteria archaeon]|nr:hypothetical protein [Halobacteria archaeon]
QTVNGKEQVQYAQTNDDPVDPADAAWGDTLEDPDQDDEFRKYVTNMGRETFDGTTVTRYEVNGVEAFKAMGASTGIDYESVTEYKAALLVDKNGITRYLYTTITFEEEGETTVIELEVKITKVGSTTVQEPDWVSKARQQTALP